MIISLYFRSLSLDFLINCKLDRICSIKNSHYVSLQDKTEPVCRLFRFETWCSNFKQHSLCFSYHNPNKLLDNLLPKYEY